MKKLGILLLAAALAVCGLAVFSACDEPGHTHSFGEWTTVTEPTCTEEGLRERVCACGEKESEELEALGHDYKGEVTIVPLCTTNGEMAYTCPRCGDSYTETLEALGHDYVKGVCARCGEEEPFTEGLIFELSEDGASYAVTVYQGVAAEVYIPSYYQGLPVTSIGDWAFSDCSSLTNITIPDSVTEIGDYAFYDCSSLTSIAIPDSVTSIGYRAFLGCSSLESIVIPDSVTSIGENAFGYCSSLTSITIPDSVTSIGDYAFSGCQSLTSITIPDSVASIGKGAFGRCSRLKSISVDPQNQAYHSEGNCLIETKSKTLIAGCMTSVIPSDGSVTSIGDYAFNGCSSLTSVTIPDSVTSIGDWAFSDCSSLTSITIPDGVTSIDEYAFSGCSSLTSITIPDSVASIGDWAFFNCRSLTSITIGEGVTSIGYRAFYSCDSLETVYYRGSEEEWNEIEIGSYNDKLEDAEIVFNYKGE